MKKEKRGYQKPRILTYSSDDILSELGPAQACSPYWGSAAPSDVPPGYVPGLHPMHEPPIKKTRDKLFGD